MPSPNGLILKELDSHLSKLSAHFGADVLTYVGPILNGVDMLFRHAIEAIHRDNVAHDVPQPDKLVIILETDGGSIEQADRMVHTMRHHYKLVDFIIPNQAMSAGTVLAMSGDTIYMDYFSILGPIDPQVENIQGNYVPALGYIERYDTLCEAVRSGEISVAEFSILINSFDQADLFRFRQATDLSITLLKQWLANYKFKNWTHRETSGTPVTDDDKVERAAEIGQKLSDPKLWHTHGRGIPLAVLRSELNLRIDDFGENSSLNPLVREYDELLSSFMQVTRQDAAMHTRIGFKEIQTS